MTSSPDIETQQETSTGTMEDLDQSRHALDISEMSDVHLDPDELKKQSKKKSETGTTNDDDQVTTRVALAYEMVAVQSQPRKSITEEQHEGLIQAILKHLVLLQGYINEDFQGDEHKRYMDLVGQLALLVVALASCDLKSENADGKEEFVPEEKEYGLEVD